MAPLNRLLRTWSLWRNLYCVTMEQISKHREGSRQIRRHARTSRTPAQRLLKGTSLTSQQRERFETHLQVHNPFEMKKKIEAQLAEVWKQKGKLEKASSEIDLSAQAASPLRCKAA